jgi:hypothetical protein
MSKKTDQFGRMVGMQHVSVGSQKKLNASVNELEGQIADVGESFNEASTIPYEEGRPRTWAEFHKLKSILKQVAYIKKELADIAAGELLQ